MALLIATLVLAAPGRADEQPLEVRVLSGPEAATSVTVRVPGAGSDLGVEDRTPGAQPATTGRGPASVGETFTDEVVVFLRGEAAPRPGAIEVADALVSVVRLFPEAGGTAVSILVRRPVSYSVSRPSALGEVRIELHGRAHATPPTVTAGGRPHRARPKTESEREVAVDADSLSYDQQTNTLTARGGVTLSRSDSTLTADEVVYDRTNGIAEAKGNVVLTDAQGTMEGDFAHLDLDNETGWVENANGVMEVSRFRLRAGRFEKLGGPKYHVTDGVFTTCQCGGLEKPSWSIACRETDVSLQGMGLARDVRFRVKDIPVLWSPAFLFPVNTDRQTGFLVPRVGYSNRRGFQYEQPFFWAINKSADMTIATDVETSARVGIIGEGRYALSPQAHGAFTAAYFNEAIRGRTRGTVEAAGVPADIPEDRYGFSGHHVQPLYGGSRFFLDLFAVSDKLFLREMNTFSFGGRRDVAQRSSRYTQSRTGVYDGWTRGYALLDATYYQDLVDNPNFDPDLLTLQRLPRAQAQHAVPLLGDRVIGSLAGEGVHFWRREGFDGYRGDFAPELFVPFHLGRVLNGSVTGQLRETAYHLDEREQVAFVVPDQGGLTAGFQRTAPELPRLDPDRTRELGLVQARTGTELSRVYPFPHFGLEKLKHTIEPEMRYLFVPQVGRPIDQAHVPCTGAPGERPGVTCNVTLLTEGFLFDERDAINRRNFFSYGFTSRLLARGAAAASVGAPTEAEGEGEGPPLEAAAGPDVDTDSLAQGLGAEAIPVPLAAPVPPPIPGTPAAGAAKPAPGPARELARASILHGYDVSRSLVGSSHQSDVDLGLRLTPLDWLGLSYNQTVGVQDGALRGLTAGVYAREPNWSPPPALRNLQSPLTVGLSYRFIEPDRAVASGGTATDILAHTTGLNEVDASVYLRLGNYLGFTFISRYDLNDATLPGGQTIGSHFLERDYFLRLISRCNCWVIEAGVADKFNPDERSFRVQFTLVGLGSFGRNPVTRNYVGFAPLAGITPRRSGPGGGLY